MPQPLTKAQKRFQAIKRHEKSMAQMRAFSKARRAIEEKIESELVARGLEVNRKAISHIAFEQAKKERAAQRRAE